MKKERSICTIYPSGIGGTIQAPGSKSAVIRAVAAGLLATDRTRILDPGGYCDDALVALEVAGKLGAAIQVSPDAVEMAGGLKPFEGSLHCGESGLVVRLFTAIAALCDRPVRFTGDASLQKRPMNDLPVALEQLGARVQTTRGFLPVTVEGPMHGGKTTIDGSTSSQYLTGLLMALPLLKEASEIHVHNLRSIPYIDLTISILDAFGVEVLNHGYKKFSIPGDQAYRGCDLVVEGDWSGAAFMLVAGALAGHVKVTNLDMDSKQADKRILNVLEKAGARVSYGAGLVEVEKNDLNAFDCDITDCPDLAPPLVALAAHSDGISNLYGAGRLAVKESHRGRVLVDEFSKLGVSIRLSDDVLSVEGKTVTGGTVFPHQDHRIAMAASILALKAQQPIEVLNPECVNKSYPGFFRDLKILGGKINE